ncbi:hypothetical protein RFI_40433, partial [Reticulomyxa filosa]
EMMKKLNDLVAKLTEDGDISDEENANADKETKSNGTEDKKTDGVVDEELISTAVTLMDARQAKKVIRKIIDNDDIIDSQYVLLAYQLQLYYEMKDEDDQQVIWNNTNLSDPEQTYHLLFKKALREKHLPDLTHILAGLLLIPKSKTYLWTVFEKIILLSTTDTRV